MTLSEILNKYTEFQINKIQDFLLSEIYEDSLEETREFIKCEANKRYDKFKDVLYTEGNYKGIFLEGNQYLIHEENGIVTIIDYISEEHGVHHSQTRIKFSVDEFLLVIENKKIILENNCT